MTVFSDVTPPKVVFETTSPLNGKIKVLEKGKTRRLIADGVTQSVNRGSPLAGRMYWGRIVDVITESLGEPSLYLGFCPKDTKVFPLSALSLIRLWLK